jgi:hypothetical protein
VEDSSKRVGRDNVRLAVLPLENIVCPQIWWCWIGLRCFRCELNDGLLADWVGDTAIGWCEHGVLWFGFLLGTFCVCGAALFSSAAHSMDCRLRLCGE